MLRKVFEVSDDILSFKSLIEGFYGFGQIDEKRFKRIFGAVRSLLEKGEIVKLGHGNFVRSGTPLGQATLAAGVIEQKLTRNNRNKAHSNPDPRVYRKKS